MTAAFRTAQPTQTFPSRLLFPQSTLDPTRKSKRHRATEVSSGDVTFTQQPVPFPQATRLDRENSTRRSSPSITSIPRAGRQHRALSGAVLQRDLELFPHAALQLAHLLTEGTVLGEGSSAAARLNEYLQGSWHCHWGTGLPRVGKPSSQERLTCNSTLKKCPTSSGTSKPAREVVSEPAGTS